VGTPAFFLDCDSLNLIERDFVLPAVVEFGCPRGFVVGDLLRHFELATVFQIGGDTSRSEAMIADPRFDPGRFRPQANDAVSVLLEEGIGCQLAGLAAGGAEEIAAHVIANASRLLNGPVL
jgi:hypothetical protein